MGDEVRNRRGEKEEDRGGKATINEKSRGPIASSPINIDVLAAVSLYLYWVFRVRRRVWLAPLGSFRWMNGSSVFDPCVTVARPRLFARKKKKKKIKIKNKKKRKNKERKRERQIDGRKIIDWPFAISLFLILFHRFYPSPSSLHPVTPLYQITTKITGWEKWEKGGDWKTGAKRRRK